MARSGAAKGNGRNEAIHKHLVQLNWSVRGLRVGCSRTVRP